MTCNKLEQHLQVRHDWVNANYDKLEQRFSENYGDMDDFDDWANEEFEEIAAHLFDEAFDNFNNCDGCEFLEVESDPYGTGDSPTVYGCDTVEPTDCPFVIEMIDTAAVEGL